MPKPAAANDNPIALSEATIDELIIEIGARVRAIPREERGGVSAMVRSSVALEVTKALVPEASNA